MADHTLLFKAVILDLDGVVTQTTRLHAKAWKLILDDFLEKQQGSNYQPFNPEDDYNHYLEGKTRSDGLRSFLASRKIELPEGNPEDDAPDETGSRLDKQQNEAFLKLIEEEGVAAYKDTIQVIKEWRSRQIKTAVVSSSRNCKPILDAAGLTDLFDAWIDTSVLAQKDLKEKPAPDSLLEASRMLKVTPDETLVVEHTVTGVLAGKKGAFKLIAGVARRGEDSALREQGADIVVNKLTELQKEIGRLNRVRDAESLPHALEKLDAIAQTIGDRQPVLFLDYDGTLSPLVSDPDKAFLAANTRKQLEELARLVSVAVVSGRDRTDVQQKVGLTNIIYAGSHGFDIEGPNGLELQYEGGLQAIPALDIAEQHLHEKTGHIKGAIVERKKYAIAVHYRNVAAEEVDKVKSAVYEALEAQEKLKKGGGKEILELKPNIDWHKGRATRWLLDALKLNSNSYIPIFIGDDITDEDAIDAVADDGIGIIVGTHGEKTAATYRLNDTEEVGRFLEKLQQLIQQHTP